MTRQQLRNRYLKKHGKLVRPDSGWLSLDPKLYLPYSMGRVRGFTDLGTHVDKPGDHGLWPAKAFDLGRKDRFYNRGWNYVRARRLAKFYWENHRALGINYIILGKQIISRKKPYWHRFERDASHMWHIHVSGI